MSKITNLVAELRLIVRHYFHRKDECPDGQTYYMLKWFDVGGEGRYRQYKYTMPTTLHYMGKWHNEPKAKLCDSGFHCSDIEHIHEWGEIDLHELYVVECGGKYNGSADKVAFSHMRVISKLPITNEKNSIEKELTRLEFIDRIGKCTQFICSPFQYVLYVGQHIGNGTIRSNYDKLSELGNSIVGSASITQILVNNFSDISMSDLIWLIKNNKLPTARIFNAKVLRGSNAFELIKLAKTDEVIKDWVSEHITGLSEERPIKDIKPTKPKNIKTKKSTKSNPNGRIK